MRNETKELMEAQFKVLVLELLLIIVNLLLIMIRKGIPTDEEMATLLDTVHRTVEYEKQYFR